MRSNVAYPLSRSSREIPATNRVLALLSGRVRRAELCRHELRWLYTSLRAHDSRCNAIGFWVIGRLRENVDPDPLWVWLPTGAW